MRQYIGARYVPRFLGAYDNTQAYEALDVVDNGMGTSYIAKVPTPAGTPLTNTTYWAVYGASSGAIINLQNQIGDLSSLLTTDKSNLVAAINEVNITLNDLIPLKDGYVTPEYYGAVGDGVTDDTAAINAAIASGKTVVFSEKVYGVSDKIISDNIVMIGNGATLKALDDITDAVLNGNFIDGFIIDGQQKQIQFGILVDNATKGAIISNCTVHGIYSDTTSAVGIHIHDVTNENTWAEVFNCHIYDIYSLPNGVTGDDQGSAIGISSYTTINCNFHNNIIHGVHVSEDGYGVYAGFRPSSNVINVIRDNYIYDIYNTGIKAHAPKTLIQHNHIVQDDISGTHMTYSIRVISTATGSLIKDNLLEYDGTTDTMYGVFLDQVESCVVSSNTLNMDASGFGIRIYGSPYSIIENNRLISTLATNVPVIGVESANTTVKNNYLVGDVGPMIRVAGDNNEIIHNRIGMTTTSKNAIECSYANYYRIIGNITNGHFKSSQATNNDIIKDNVFYGIELAASENMVINGNCIEDDASVGIYTTGAAKNALISDNIIKCTATGISAGGASINIVNNDISKASTPITMNYGKDGAIVLNRHANGTSFTTTGSTNITVANNIELSA